MTSPQRVRFGYWTPIFGGWLRNVDDEQTPVSFAHIAEIARAAEEGGFDLTLIPELNLNDIKGVEAPSLDAWAVTAGLAVVTSRLELLAAVAPASHNPFHTAKQAATIDEISGGRFTLNVVSAWWAEEAKQYDGLFSAHDDRYARTIEWVEVLRGLWTQTPFAYEGEYYRTEGTYLEPKPRVIPRLTPGRERSGPHRDHAVRRRLPHPRRHGRRARDEGGRHATPARRGRRHAVRGVRHGRVRDRARHRGRGTGRDRPHHRRARGSGVRLVPGLREQVEARHPGRPQGVLVSNRGLRPNLVGTPDQVAERIVAFANVGVSTLLLQFSPHLPELQRFAAEVIPRVRRLEALRDA